MSRPRSREIAHGPERCRPILCASQHSGRGSLCWAGSFCPLPADPSNFELRYRSLRNSPSQPGADFTLSFLQSLQQTLTGAAR